MGEHYEIAVAAQCKLGEGPHFDARTQNLYWVDILSGTVHIHNLTTNETRSLDVGKYPSLIIPTPEDPQTAYVAVEDGIFLLNLQTGQKTLHSRPEIRQGYRYNDGKLDPQGRLWVGSMDISEEKNDGKLYMINRDGSFQTRLQDLSISNGLDWLDSKMFFIDSPTKHVDSFDYNPTTGELSNRTTVVSIKDNTGVPDGMTLTPDGKIMLICHWGGSGVYIYETTSGKHIRTLSLPCAHTTSCCWAGNDLYVTSAKKGRSEEELKQEPHAGDVFVFKNLLPTL